MIQQHSTVALITNYHDSYMCMPKIENITTQSVIIYCNKEKFLSQIFVEETLLISFKNLDKNKIWCIFIYV